MGEFTPSSGAANNASGGTKHAPSKPEGFSAEAVVAPCIAEGAARGGGNSWLQDAARYLDDPNPRLQRDWAMRLVGSVYVLSLDRQGCRLVQKALEVLDRKGAEALTAELRGHVLERIGKASWLTRAPPL